MTHCIIYFSTSSWSFTSEDIQDILQQSRSRNAQVGITGVLLYMHGHIIQVLEGDKPAVDDLFERIKKDTRHKQVICVLNQSIKAHLFSQWSMGYETLTTQQFDEIRTIIDLDKPKPVSETENESAIVKTLRGFYKINHQL
ncbi:BLUF domain-containing protein [Spirosoma pollinicola]|uniref:BLUF domain-containing protein n=1 Tax=Spirosoma pollinicola TaxID=2057025 RepID=UPI0012FE05F0|nr:BLUF domain-containing protein [Spirosoma pollinicola]